MCVRSMKEASFAGFPTYIRIYVAPTAVKTTKIRITVVYPDKAASFIDRDTKHSVRRGGCRARKRIIYGNF